MGTSIGASLRIIRKNKALSAIKVAGLAVGATVFLLTSLFCLEEISYDTQHPYHDRIFRYLHRVNLTEGMQEFAFTSATIGPALTERFPEVEAFSRVHVSRVSLQNEKSDIAFNEEKFAFADANFFTLFHFPVKGQTPATVLAEPQSLVLTPSSAARYFGDQDPLGKTLRLNGKMDFVVKGVLLEDFRRTHFDFDFVASFSSLEVIKNDPALSSQIQGSLNLETKGYSSFYTYLLLSPGSPASALELKFPSFIEEFRGKGRSERLKPALQSLTSIHLHSHLLYEIDQNGSAFVVYLYLFIGLVVLFISCINYVNISIAECLNRAKSIGLRKIMGARSSSIVFNHLGETALLTSISLLVASGLCLSVLTPFNMTLDRSISFFTDQTTFLIIGLFLLVVFLSGLYPAIHTAQTRGLEAFRGKLQSTTFSLSLRNALVFIQLLVSFCMVAVAFLVYYQLDYLLQKDPGFDSHQVLVINAASGSPHQRIALKNRLLAEKQIVGASLCSTPPGEPLFSVGISMPGTEGEEEKRVLMYQSFVDEDYLRTLGVPLLAGRFFDESNAADSAQYVIVNEAAVNTTGVELINRSFDVPDIFTNGRNKKAVVGIIKDFNFASFHKLVEPLLLEYNPARCRYLLVRTGTSPTQASLTKIEQAWKEVMPGMPFDYHFLDSGFARFYDQEQRQKKVIASIAAIAISLAALGLFGTTLFVVQQRTKEAGIRKVLGSSRAELLFLMMRPTLAMVLVACLAGIPIALFSGNSWLEKYPYRINFSSWLLVAAFLVVLGIVVFTVLHHFVRVTRVNPAEVLRENP